MNAWERTFNDILAGKLNIIDIPRPVMDMITEFEQQKIVFGYGNHPYPILMVRALPIYTRSEIASAVDWLFKYNIKGFVIAERSTAAMELMYYLLAYNDTDENYTIRLAHAYNKTEVGMSRQRTVLGILATIKRKARVK